MTRGDCRYPYTVWDLERQGAAEWSRRVRDVVVPVNRPILLSSPDWADQLVRRITWGRFARIMEEVWRCLLHEQRKDRLIARYEAAQRVDAFGLRMDWRYPSIERDLRGEASREWSRRVREGVRALPPPGPVVYCEGEEE